MDIGGQINIHSSICIYDSIISFIFEGIDRINKIKQNSILTSCGSTEV